MSANTVWGFGSIKMDRAGELKNATLVAALLNATDRSVLIENNNAKARRDAATGAETRAFEHGGGVGSVAFSPDGRWLAAGDSSNKLIVRDADTGAEKRACDGMTRSGALSLSGLRVPALSLNRIASARVRKPP